MTDFLFPFFLENRLLVGALLFCVRKIKVAFLLNFNAQGLQR